jgi:uncharacterized membrane protein
MANKTSQHILGTASNLVGFCLFVITSLHISNYAAQSMIDEFTSAIALLLIVSCLISFLSIRTQNPERSDKLETIADYLFAASLIGISVVILFIVFGYIE